VKLLLQPLLSFLSIESNQYFNRVHADLYMCRVPVHLVVRA